VNDPLDTLPPEPPRSWDILLIGGASGTGKTTAAYQIAHRLGVGITQVDDFQVVLERMTTPAQQPALHFWRTHPDPGSLSAEEIHEQGLDIRRVMRPALEAVVANHLAEHRPVVLEGDFIHPALAAQRSFGDEPAAGRVRGVFLYEPEVEQIVRNYLAREPETGRQETRARVSALYAAWGLDQCEGHGLPALEVRPWDTLAERILAAIA
jgi:2-phosphoglycerate kinase